MHVTQLDIMLVDDDENDVFFVRRAVKGSPHVASLHVLSDGEEAIKFFKRQGQYADKHKWPPPNVLLLDLKMPKINGFEVLEWLRKNPECSVIPTMVYSSSRLESDVRKAYGLGANAYFVKPLSMGEFMEFLRSAADFWSKCEILTIDASGTRHAKKKIPAD